ncbi:MAG: hypothetical protein JOZ49_15915 [Mycolicibacterium sp.]|nr:hypothetical protein [Mycolicibacterium sp.]
MQDVIFVAGLVVLAAVTALFAVGCDRLMGPDEAAMSEAGRKAGTEE